MFILCIICQRRSSEGFYGRGGLPCVNGDGCCFLHRTGFLSLLELGG